MKKKKPIVPIRKNQNFLSGRNVPESLNREMNKIAKKVRK